MRELFRVLLLLLAIGLVTEAFNYSIVAGEDNKNKAGSAEQKAANKKPAADKKAAEPTHPDESERNENLNARIRKLEVKSEALDRQQHTLASRAEILEKNKQKMPDSRQKGVLVISLIALFGVLVLCAMRFIGRGDKQEIIIALQERETFLRNEIDMLKDQITKFPKEIEDKTNELVKSLIQFHEAQIREDMRSETRNQVAQASHDIESMHNATITKAAERLREQILGTLQLSLDRQLTEYAGQLYVSRLQPVVVKEIESALNVHFGKEHGVIFAADTAVQNMQANMESVAKKALRSYIDSDSFKNNIHNLISYIVKKHLTVLPIAIFKSMTEWDESVRIEFGALVEDSISMFKASRLPRVDAKKQLVWLLSELYVAKFKNDASQLTNAIAQLSAAGSGWSVEEKKVRDNCVDQMRKNDYSLYSVEEVLKSLEAIIIKPAKGSTGSHGCQVEYVTSDVASDKVVELVEPRILFNDNVIRKGLVKLSMKS